MNRTAMCALLASGVVAAACGGTSVVDGQNETNTTTTSTTTTSTSTTTTTTSGCDDHGDCQGGVCIFSTGLCGTACDGFCGNCGSGAICDECATSSCPQCLDCMAACVPIGDDQCDDANPCGFGQQCLFGTHECVDTCSSSGCADPNQICQMCGTGSCCGCDDCVDICVDI